MSRVKKNGSYPHLYIQHDQNKSFFTPCIPQVVLMKQGRALTEIPIVLTSADPETNNILPQEGQS
jgi:hypothetical protein